LAVAYYARGVVYQKKGDKAKAEQDFAQAKKLGYKPEADPVPEAPSKPEK
jgi:Flp pilus assembly protein TadD